MPIFLSSVFSSTDKNQYRSNCFLIGGGKVSSDVDPTYVSVDGRVLHVWLPLAPSQRRWPEGDRALVVVYDVTSVFLPVRRAHYDIYPPEEKNVVLVKNKKDLPGSRQVAKIVGETLAQRFQCLFLEVSVQDPTDVENVQLLFQAASKLGVRRRWEKEPPWRILIISKA